MDSRVEARSLTSINALASNPPQYPSGPVGQQQEALVLYISRVPGSRDIILSTHKPQLKNVTAEDVARSLYYVHFNSPEDDLLLPVEHKSGSQSPRSSSESQPIKRKPLPGQQPTSLSTRLEPQTPATTNAQELPTNTAPPPYSPYNPDSSRAQPPSPPPHLDQSHIASQNQFPLAQQAPVARKPVRSVATSQAPRTLQPPQHEQHHVSFAVPDSQRSRSPSPNGRWVEEQNPTLPPRPSQQQPQSPSLSHGSASPVHQNMPSSPRKKKKPFTPFSLTVIRRDPTQNLQWNVGQVASFQNENPEQMYQEGHHSVQQSPSISIHLETSGYAKFRGTATRPSMDEGSRTFEDRPSGALDPAVAAFLSGRPDPSTVMNQGGFDREVLMSYSPSFTSNVRSLFNGGRSRSGSKGPEEISALPVRPSHQRENSTASVNAFFSEFEGAKPIITNPAPGLRPRGYVFRSPWDGRCEFVTGNAGRSLRCNHIMPQVGGKRFNPLVDGSDEESSGGMAAWPGAGISGSGGGREKKNRNIRAVSELRFNFPSSELFQPREKRDHSKSIGSEAERAKDQLQSGFNKVIQSIDNYAQQQRSANGPFGRHESDDEIWGEDSRLDMSLGQEKAGGGNRGKRAKMGKLIIAEDGFKMLDLVVSANVGIWWASWEKLSSS